MVAQIVTRHGQCYINVDETLSDEQGRLKVEYAIGDMHIKPKG